ncbi:MAG: hypothetical protein AAF288_10855 [Planctomycetota bacterium]
MKLEKVTSPLRLLLARLPRMTDRAYGPGQRDLAQALRTAGPLERARLAEAGEQAPGFVYAPASKTARSLPLRNRTTAAPIEYFGLRLALAAGVALACAVGITLRWPDPAPARQIAQAPDTDPTPAPTAARFVSDFDNAVRKIGVGAGRMIEQQAVPRVDRGVWKPPAVLASAVRQAEMSDVAIASRALPDPLEQEWSLLVRDARRIAVAAVGVEPLTAPVPREGRTPDRTFPGGASAPRRANG